MIEHVFAFPWYQLEDLIIPILFGFVLPITIVYLVVSAKKHSADRKAQMYIAALEKGNTPDPDFFKKEKKEVDTAAKKSARDRFTNGCIVGLVGLAFLLIGLFNVGLGFIIPGGILLAVGAGNVISFYVTKKYHLDD